MDPESATPSTLTVTVGDEGDRAALSGALDIRTLSEAEKSLGHWPKKRKSGALAASDESDDIEHVMPGVVRAFSKLDAPNAQSLAAVTPEGQIPEIASEKSSLTTVLDQLPKVIKKFSAIEEQTKKVMTDIGEVTGKIKENPLLRLGAPREKPASAPNETTAPATKAKATRSR